LPRSLTPPPPCSPAPLLPGFAALSLRLTDVWFAQDNVISGAALPVRLCWQGEPDMARYTVMLRLFEASGALVAKADDLLVDAALHPTELWASDPVATYHLLPLPVGLLPQGYTLELDVYAVDDPAAPVGITGKPTAGIKVEPVYPLIEPWQDISLYGLAVVQNGPEIKVGTALRLTYAALDRGLAYPGETVFVELRWELRAEGPLPESYQVALVQEDTVLATATLFQYLSPSLTFPEGRPLLEHVALPVPPEARDGTAKIVLLAEGDQHILGELTLSADEHTFIAPPVAHPVNARVGDVATLLGFDLVPGTTVQSGIPFTLTLVWRAEAGTDGTDLTVFTHLTGADGIIAAQHDGKPAAWTRPTGGWLPGEIIVDAHPLAWQRSYTGLATLSVGLYEATTGARVLWEDGGDAIVLGEDITVMLP
ncbi:MAG: hypothetical protein JXA33_06855, partial [Anaerolineae bacterium]|nr:hypothetical protein [Anaerolineae bacterium]